VSCAALLSVPGLALADGQHTIAPGETLSAIAAHYGVGIDEVAAANNIADEDFVIAGTVLTIPGHEATYVVQEGDTLAALARAYGTTVTELAARNEIADPNLVVIGQPLKVPASSQAGLAAAAASSARTPPPPASRSEIEAALDYWADRNGIDPNLAKGLSWHESGWQQDVVSSTGAVGVMQLMPEASDHISRNLIGVDLDPDAVDDNVRMGVRYLRQLLVNFDGDERLALASYYQGERAVRTYGVYQESERFVANVLANRDYFADR
jgi:soluble lytic murein transglycosylase-like protein